ncbi:Bcr/CflA family drug resistance efflux transporter [Amylibacter ulvae]|uniref:Bcr/CflA family efflux transporter n=1 Tax=Paramylibacter ulvae TaxID=1651968 RepID=A0ABQ3D3E3_9RHOB|nr:multidrug effflux MFS transporter [Amylibacter ulvae]GHA54641.1 Bcr/CflA family drug resistance efflux transporter [Amylibacter ulvae]
MKHLPPPTFLNKETPPHILTLVAIAGVAAIPLNIFLATLPAMAEYFDTPNSMMQLAVSGYLALTAVIQLIIGPLSDRFGRRPVTLVGLAIFILASVGAALSQSFVIFMIFRAFQTAASTGMAISRATVRDMVPRNKAASLIGYVTMGMSLAPMIAPPIGGFLGAAFGWQANFYVLTGAGALVFLLAYFDQGETNINKSTSIGAQFRAYPELLTSRRFWGYAATNAFAAGTFFAYLGGAPFIAKEVYGLGPSTIGIYLMITPIGYMIGNGISGRFSTVMGIERMLLVGGMVTVVPMVISMAVIAAGVTHPLGLFAFTFFIGFGNGMVLPSANAGLLDVNPALAGSASGLGGALLTFGGALLAGLTGYLLVDSTTAIPLVACIFASSLIALITSVFTIRIERAVRIAA